MTKRLALLALLFSLMTAVLILRLGYLQVIKGETYFSLSEHNRIHIYDVPAPRGLITDQRGAVLATSRPAFTISFVPLATTEPQLEQSARLLAHLLDGDESDYLSRMRAGRELPFRPVPLVQNTDRQTAVRIAEHRNELPGVVIRSTPVRSYPLGSAAAHLLGYLSEVSRGQLDGEWGAKGYEMGDLIGMSGVESLCEDFLRGKKGWEEVEVDAYRQPIRTLSIVGSSAGHSVRLTIDADLQRWAAEGLAGRAGAVAAIEPGTGRLLCLYSSPAYDPNIFVDASQSTARLALLADTSLPLYNRAAQSVYSPGSTFKTVTMAAGLESGLLNEGTRFTCYGVHQGQRCWKDGGHGTLDLIGGFRNSCNVYFYQAGERIGGDLMSATARRLGLGARPGLGLSTEAEGVIPNEAWERAHVRGGDGEHWGAGDNRNMAIGQGYVLVSPLQMAVMTASVGARGNRHVPQAVEEVRGSDGRLFYSFEPRLAPESRSFSEETSRLMLRALASAVNFGTGRRARVEGIVVGGKTGTAQNPHGEDHGWFIGLAPVDDPKIAIAVMVEHGGGGGAAAAPVAQRMIAGLAERDCWPRRENPTDDWWRENE